MFLTKPKIDIEIQLSRLLAWADRSLFYLSKMYTEQIGEGEDYTVFKKCVGISILDFKLFEGSTDFYSCFHIREDTRNTVYTDKMEFHVIELPKLPKELKDSSSELLLWAKFIAAERKEEFDMVAEKNPYIKSAYAKLQVISQDKQKRLEYEARQKAILDYNQSMREATEQGLAQGRAEERRLWEQKESAWKQKESVWEQKESAWEQKESAWEQERQKLMKELEDLRKS